MRARPRRTTRSRCARRRGRGESGRFGSGGLGGFDANGSAHACGEGSSACARRPLRWQRVRGQCAWWRCWAVGHERTVRHALHQADVEANPAHRTQGKGGEQARKGAPGESGRCCTARRSLVPLDDGLCRERVGVSASRGPWADRAKAWVRDSLPRSGRRAGRRSSLRWGEGRRVSARVRGRSGFERRPLTPVLGRLEDEVVERVAAAERRNARQ